MELEASDIVALRRKAFRETEGAIDSRVSCLTCRMCSNFPVARTPLDHEFRKMWAWRSGAVASICDCPVINGFQDGDRVAVVRGDMTLARNCEKFQVDFALSGWSGIDRCVRADAGMVEGVKPYDDFLQDAIALDDSIDGMTAEISDLHRKAKLLMDRRKSLEDKRDFLFMHRYDRVDGVPDYIAGILGAVSGSEYEAVRSRSSAVRAAGFVPWKGYDVPMTPTADALSRLLASGLVDESELHGYGTPLTMKMLAVDVNSEKKLVRFVESQSFFALRLTSPVYTALFGDRKCSIWKDF